MRYRIGRATLTLSPACFPHRLPSQTVAISGGNTRVGDGVIPIDSSRSFDPDGDEGALSFSWACAPPPTPLVGAAYPPIPGYTGCQSTDGTPAVIDGSPSPSIQVALLGTQAGANYTLTVTVTKADRVATGTVWLLVVAKSSPPVISIDRLTAEKVNPAQKLTLRASVASSFPATLVVAWTVASSPPGLADLLTRPGVAGTPLSSPSLVINADTLPPRSTLVLRLSATDAGGSSVGDVTVPVSDAPTGVAGDGSKGSLSVSPPSGTGLTTPFTLSCGGWTDTDLPLSYAFAYIVPGIGGQQQRTLLGDFKPSSELPGVLLPAGDPSRDNVVSVICLVQNSFGALAESDPVFVRVEWDQSVLTDTAAQSALVNTQAAEATSLVLTGNPDSALAVVSGLSALLNTDPTTRRRLTAADALERRRRLAVAAEPTEMEKAKAELRSALLGVVSDVVLVSSVSTTVRFGSARGRMSLAACALQHSFFNYRSASLHFLRPPRSARCSIPSLALSRASPTPLPTSSPRMRRRAPCRLSVLSPLGAQPFPRPPLLR